MLTFTHFQELNQVYNISQDQEHVKAQQQAHLLHNLQNSVENNFETGPVDPALHQTYFEGQKFKISMRYSINFRVMVDICTRIN